MSAALIRRIVLCLAIAAPAILTRATGAAWHPVVELLMFGAAVVAASFVLAWAAEAAQKDISGTLAIALLALIAVLPEFAVDLYYAFRSGSDADYTHFAAANMTGSSRLILGFGWSLVAVIAIVVMRNRARAAGESAAGNLPLPLDSRRTVGFLAWMAIAGLLIAILGSIPVWLGVLLVGLFVFFLVRAGQADDDATEEFLGAAALVADLPQRTRRITVVALFIVAAGIILLSAEPFAEALVASGTALGLDSFHLVQWLAPLASEAPEFIIAVMFALRGNGAAAIGTLMASNANQWSLLVGALPIAHLVGGGSVALPLDDRQVAEFVLTATLTLLGVAIVLGLRFPWWAGIVLAGLFAMQFIVTGVTGRYVLSAVQAALAIVVVILQRRHLAATLIAPFRRTAQPVTAVPQEDAATTRR